METHQFENESLIVSLTNAPILGTQNFVADLWFGERTVKLAAPSAELILVEPFGVSGRLATSEQKTIRSKSTDSMNQYIADRMSRIGPVERIYSKYRDQVFYTWIVIEKRDREVQRSIYATEQQIMNRFPEMQFDFYVVYRSGLDPDSLVSGVDLVYPRE